jgi:hypothetical protein
MHIPLPGTALTDAEALHTAQQLRAYMTFRAGHEGMVHDLLEHWYLDRVLMGCVKFFGVRIGAHGELLSDELRPALFAE